MNSRVSRNWCKAQGADDRDLLSQDSPANNNAPIPMESPDAPPAAWVPSNNPDGQTVTLTGAEVGTVLRRDQLHPRLEVFAADAMKQLPTEMAVRTLALRRCNQLLSVDSKLSAARLSVNDCPEVRAVAGEITCRFLNLANCRSLRYIGRDVTVAGGWLRVAKCPNLERVDARLEGLCEVDLSGSGLLRWLPSSLQAERLILAGCSSLQRLPRDIWSLEVLDISGCRSLNTLPAGLKVNEWIEVAGSALTHLPRSLVGVPLRWRGEVVDPELVLGPIRWSATEACRESDPAVRQLMLDRLEGNKSITGGSPRRRRSRSA